MKPNPDKKPLTKKRFEAILSKVFTTPKDAQEVKQTSVVHPSDGCTETGTNRGKTEDAKD